MFVGLTQTEATRIVTMATAEVHPIDFETKQQQSEATVFTVTEKPHSSTEGGNNDVTTNQHQETVNKDEASDKKRKAIEATSPTPASQRFKGNGRTCGATDPAMIDDSTSVPNPNKHPPATDRIEDWLDDDAAADQGFIRTGRKPYRPLSQTCILDQRWMMIYLMAMTGSTKNMAKPFGTPKSPSSRVTT